MTVPSSWSMLSPTRETHTAFGSNSRSCSERMRRISSKGRFAECRMSYEYREMMMNTIKAVSFSLAVFLGVGSGAMAGPAKRDQINVVASLSDFGSIAQAVGGDKVQVAMIASGVQDPHFVDPKPSYVLKLRDADLFLVNGLELEIGWAPPLPDGARNPKIKPSSAGYVDCSRNIPFLEGPVGAVTPDQG